MWRYPQKICVGSHSSISNNKPTEAEAEQIRLKVSNVLSNAKTPVSNITTAKKKSPRIFSPWIRSIAIWPADKGRCTVVLNTTDYGTKILNLLGDTNTYEKLKRDPTRPYKKKVIDLLQKLEKEQDRTTILPSSSRRSHPLLLWTA